MSAHQNNDQLQRTDHKEAVQQSRSSAEPSIRRVAFHELSEGLDIVLITCGDEVYQLKQTRFGKLLLNK